MEDKKDFDENSEVKEINESEMHHLQRVLDLYPFQVNDIRLLSNKSGRTTWEVETTEGIKILKQAQMKPRRMLFLAGAHHYLQQKGLAITPIHPTKNGAVCIGAEQHSYVLYDKVEGNEMIYYNKEQMLNAMQFAGQFHQASKGYLPADESKKRSRLGKWHKLFRWKLQELEGNKQIALSYPTDQFSIMFLEYVDKMLARGRDALESLDSSHYEKWTQETIEDKSFCQQDFTLARFIEVDEAPYMKELHSITFDLPSRDLRIILNKLMKKLSVWDQELAIQLLGAYDSANPLTEEQYRVLWIDLAFPHLFCSIAHKYYLEQKRSWSDEKYIWALQNIIAVENSKDEFLANLPNIFQAIKQQGGGKVDEK